MSADLTPEERAEWRQEADRTLARLLSDANSRTVADRILRLLDALDAAEAYRTTPELALELARVAQERAAAAEAERSAARAAETCLRAANGRARDRAIAAGLSGADLAGPEEMVEALVIMRDEALAEGQQVREALGLVSGATAEQVVYHIECMWADHHEMLRERIDIAYRWDRQAARARAWGRAEGLAEARDRLRRDASDQRRGSEAQRYARRLADDLDPNPNTETR